MPLNFLTDDFITNCLNELIQDFGILIIGWSPGISKNPLIVVVKTYIGYHNFCIFQPGVSLMVRPDFKNM